MEDVQLNGKSIKWTIQIDIDIVPIQYRLNHEQDNLVYNYTQEETVNDHIMRKIMKLM